MHDVIILNTLSNTEIVKHLFVCFLRAIAMNMDSGTSTCNTESRWEDVTNYQTCFCFILHICTKAFQFQ